VRSTQRDRVNPAEPEPAANDPVMPDDLMAEAKPVWERVMGESGAAGVIHAADSDILRLYREGRRCRGRPGGEGSSRARYARRS
jgi:hypothetical protein